LNIDSDYSAAWRDLRKRRLIAWGFFFSYIPYMFLFGAIGSRLAAIIGFKEDLIWLPLFFIWGSAFAIVNFRLALFRCPRCDARFFWTWYLNTFARRCLHCGLRRGAISD
jgi:hypothetical protein